MPLPYSGPKSRQSTPPQQGLRHDRHSTVTQIPQTASITTNCAVCTVNGIERVASSAYRQNEGVTNPVTLSLLEQKLLPPCA
jgi:hypothetical protein